MSTLPAPVREAFGVPVGFDTDVNGAAWGEGRWGAAQGLDTFIYITVGTGIGGGAVVNGKPIHALVHPEMGHVFVPQNREEDPYAGRCPYHGNCLEGMASGPAIEERWGVIGHDLGWDHPAWDLEAKYLAYGIIPQIYILSPQRIIMGGGVMDQEQLFPKVRSLVQDALNGYVQSPMLTEQIHDYIVPRGTGKQGGRARRDSLGHARGIGAVRGGGAS